MPVPRNRYNFQAQLRETGHHWLIVMPVVVAIGCMAGQAIFTDYLKGPHASYLLVTLSVTVLLIIGEAIIKRPSRPWKLFQQVCYYGISFLGFGYIFPLPSPYLIFMILLGLLTYFDFGYKGLNIGMGGLFLALGVRYVQINGFGDPTKFSVFIVSFVSTVVMIYYATAFLKITQDEMEQVERSSKRARANEQQVQSLINNMTDGVIAVDSKSRVMIYNAAALDVLDLNLDVKNKLLSDFFKPIDAQGQNVDVQKLLRSSAASQANRDLRLRYNDGSVINLFISVAPIYLGYGRRANNGYTIILRDITREKSLEEERDEFISVVSHELRTPIAIAEGNIGNAQFIADKQDDLTDVKQSLDEAHNQVIFLADMINDLSTLSRAERGKLEVEAENIDIKSLLKELADNYKPQAESKGLTLSAELPADSPTLQSSKLYVREVLQNFITNAIKYTEKGGVTIGAEASPDGVRFFVRDTGIGIGKGDQERVFDKFFRSEDYRTRANNGTGLGLYVTMKLSRLLHADISLESELNKGSTFTIAIPNYVPVATPPKPKNEAPATPAASAV